jgi:hypothetical protein
MTKEQLQSMSALTEKGKRVDAAFTVDVSFDGLEKPISLDLRKGISKHPVSGVARKSGLKKSEDV